MERRRDEIEGRVNSNIGARANRGTSIGGSGALLVGTLLLGALLLFLGCATDATQIRTASVDGREELLLGPVPFDGPDGSALVEITAMTSAPAGVAENGSAEGPAAGDAAEEGAVEAQAGAVEAGAAVSFPVSPLEREAPRRVEDARFVSDTGATYPLEELRFLYADEAVIRYESVLAPEDLMKLGRAVTENESLITLEARRSGELYRYEARSPFYEAMRKLYLRLQ